MLVSARAIFDSMWTYACAYFDVPTYKVTVTLGVQCQFCFWDNFMGASVSYRVCGKLKWNSWRLNQYKYLSILHIFPNVLYLESSYTYKNVSDMTFLPSGQRHNDWRENEAFSFISCLSVPIIAEFFRNFRDLPMIL